MHGAGTYGRIVVWVVAVLVATCSPLPTSSSVVNSSVAVASCRAACLHVVSLHRLVLNVFDGFGQRYGPTIPFL
ncbi:hypothetical protein Pcinc_030780 [Petrolisthes cinctipes]|uniref:Secreted protein n=1 Tax=Petrolisthes cinctipes TaxID=88211 RepID=A0AAE1K238_PETCI|nr:hypothetical protein Pcinc_030780 [Petrolisthes cinctipes]